MTSVKNVMAIASHLQFLESSLSNILIEAALKLTTLTDSSFFILIDGPNGRKYAGADALKDVFKKEGLMRENGDAEMNIEGEIRVRAANTAANEMYRVEAASSSSAGGLGGGGGTSNGGADSASAANAAAAAAASSLAASSLPERRSTRKRSHPADALGAGGGGSGMKEKRLTMEVYDSEDLVEMESTAVDIYFQPEIGNIHSRSATSTTADLGLEEEDASAPGQSPPDESFFYEDESHMPETAFDEPSNYYEIEEDDVQPYDYLQGWSLTEYLSENPKAQTLKAINDASIAEKGSVSYKLLTSLLWDVAKEVTDLAPDVKSSKTPFFASLFEELWNYFPCLDSLQNDGFKIKMKEHDYTLKAHLKKTIASCIRHRCVAKNKVNKKVVKRPKK